MAAPQFDSPGTEGQDSMTDQREIMLDSKVLKRTFLGYDPFEKFPQLWNVPPTTTEFVMLNRRSHVFAKQAHVALILLVPS